MIWSSCKQILIKKKVMLKYLTIKPRQEVKKWYLPSKLIVPSPFKSASLIISFTSSSVNASPKEQTACFNSSQLIDPDPSLSNIFKNKLNYIN